MPVRLPAGRALRLCAAAATALPLLAACGPGFVSATDQVVADNAAGETGDLLARAVVLVKSPDAEQAALAGTLLNRGSNADVLTTIDITENVPDARTITLTPNLELPPRELVALGTEEIDPITVTEAGELDVGNFAEVVLRFEDSGAVRMVVPIEDRTHQYADIVPRTDAQETQADAIRRATNCRQLPAGKERRACKVQAREARDDRRAGQGNAERAGKGQGNGQRAGQGKAERAGQGNAERAGQGADNNRQPAAAR